MKITIHNTEAEFIDHTLARPLHISSGVIREVTEARVRVRLAVDGQEVEGRGSILLSDLWAWRDNHLSHEQKDATLRGYVEGIGLNLPSICGESEHPLQAGLRLHEAVEKDDDAPPLLARAMCASPFDAAIHDGVGRALRKNAFDLYDEAVSVPETDSLFREGNTIGAIRSMLRDPAPELAAWCMVGMGDVLEDSLRPAVERDGFRCFKLKILGNTEEDAAQTVRVYKALRSFGLESPVLSLDTNEANPDANSVLEFLDRLEAEDAGAYAAVVYLEQPTDRDIDTHAFDWRAVTTRKPVLLDEGLTSFNRLQTAMDQGWSGLALKTCKGHSFALAAAAWAVERGMPISLQDLTNTGYSAIHAALLASRIPTINGVELNSPQLMPDANAEWLPRLSGLFEPRNGVHRLPAGVPVGLGTDPRYGMRDTGTR